MGERFRELNTLAVELAKQARENAAELPVYIAGSISTFSPHNDDSREPPEKTSRANYRVQAEVLAEAGVDIIALEMMRDIAQTRYAVEATVSTGLPVWVGFSCKRAADGTVVLWDGGHTLAEALSQIPPLGASLVNVMHALVEDVEPALREVTAGWEGPVGAYPHSGKFIMPNWQFTDMISPENFARRAREWLDLGAQVIGGCCGIGPDHIRALKEELPATVAAEG